MNNQTLINAAKLILKEGLTKCTEEQRFIFKKMYSFDNVNADVNDVVDNMLPDKLDWAITQVEHTIKKNDKIIPEPPKPPQDRTWREGSEPPKPKN